MCIRDRAGTRYPKKRETYYKMAEVLKVDVNYLLTDDEEFLLLSLIHI